MSLRPIHSAIILGLSLAGPSHAEERWKPLLDEKLTRWEIWLGYPHPSIQGLPPEVTAPDANGKKKPLGLNNDPKKVYTVKMQDGEPVMRSPDVAWHKAALPSHTGRSRSEAWRQYSRVWVAASAGAN